jgi:uncharacterized protein with ParB-like and HNH nuclease domain/predicted transport protein
LKATEARFIDFLRKSPQFIVPIYQRTYSWTGKECRQLWEDIIRAGSTDEISAHFVGSVVYIEQGLYSISSQSPLLVIDGQQRLTTVSLLLAALAQALEGQGEPLDGFSARKIRNWYLVNPEEEQDRHFKLLLSQTDRDSLLALLKGIDQPVERSLRVNENYELFESLIADRHGDLLPVCKGIAKLMLVDISLTRDHDNPQLIFESMNSTGRELSQADLIRNFILMGLEPDLQTSLYEKYWRPMEIDFGQEAYQAHFDGFMRHYLTIKTGDIPRINEVYDAFKQLAQDDGDERPDIESLVADVRKFARYFCAMALGTESDDELGLAFHDLRELRVDVAYPFLLELYDDYTVDLLSREEFLTAIRLVESYVFRRVVCSIPTNSLNKTFATFASGLRKDRYLESIQAHLMLLPTYRRYPDDQEFRRFLESSDLYNTARRGYWLRRLENHGRKERVPVEQYTIEHIMPQNDNLSGEWRSALGPDWENIHQSLLHTLGNLTLTGYNSEYSDRPFAEKRDMEGGFAQSPLKLNSGLGMLTTWNEPAIRDRANKLATKAIAVWTAPTLTDAMLEPYRPQKSPITYGIEDHVHLGYGHTRTLFDALRKELISLDPNVTEEFLKVYVAYKAETNFVDVVPQASGLHLSLNIPYPEIDDPLGRSRDVSAIGRWGNGDVSVGLNNLDQIPYVMGLIRQSFDRQMELVEA